MAVCEGMSRCTQPKVLSRVLSPRYRIERSTTLNGTTEGPWESRGPLSWTCHSWLTDEGGGAMGKPEITAAVRRSFVVRSTKASARLERREVPAGHVRSVKVQEFVSSLRAKTE